MGSVKLDRAGSRKFWDTLPVKSHDGNLHKRWTEQECIHNLVKYYNPKNCVEFGYNVGHSAVIVLDALSRDSKLYSFSFSE